MPVVVEYNPVAAIGRLAAESGRRMGGGVGGGGGGAYIPPINAENMPGDVIDLGGGMSAVADAYGNPGTPFRSGYDATGRPISANGHQVGAGQVQYGATAPQAGGGSSDNGLIQYGPDAGGFVGGQNRGLQDYSIPGSDTQMGTTIDPNGRGVISEQQTAMPAAPQSVKVTGAQKTALQNLEATGATGEAFQQGMRKILGLPEPTVEYTGPDGQTYNVKPEQAAALKQRDEGLKQKSAQNAAMNAQRETTAKERASTHTDLVKYRNELLELQGERNKLTREQIAGHEGEALRKREENATKFMQLGQEKGAALDVRMAKTEVENYIKSQVYVKPDDPKLMELQGAWKQAIDQEKQIIEQGRQVKQQPSPAPTQPAGEAPATQPATQGQSQPREPAPAFSATQMPAKPDSEPQPVKQVTVQVPGSNAVVQVMTPPYKTIEWAQYAFEYSLAGRKDLPYQAKNALWKQYAAQLGFK